MHYFSRSVFLSLFLFFPAFSQQPEYASHTHKSLAQFSHLARQCYASLRSTHEKDAFAAFKAITNCYQKNRLSLENIDALSSEEVEELSNECILTLNRNITQLRRAPLFVSAQPNEITNEMLFSSLDEAMNAFIEQHEKNLLKKTSTPQLLKRLTLQSCIETAALFADYAVKEESDTKRETTVPSLATRLKSFGNISEAQGKEILLKMGINSARLLAHYGVDELAPKGLESYHQRLLELLLPLFVAGTIIATTSHHKVSTVMSSCALRAFSRFTLTRGLMNKKNSWYLPMNMLAYLTPCFLGETRNFIRRDKDGTLHALQDGKVWQNAAFDGLASLVIYEGIPSFINMLIPRTIAMNPEHRRKPIRNIVRDGAAGLFKQASITAFTPTAP